MRRTTQSLFIFALLWSVLNSSALAFGQAVSARLEGVVQDETKALVPSAKVSATQAETGATTVVLSSTVGQYVFPHLNPGHYTVHVEAPTFSAAIAVVKNIKLEIGDSKRVDITLVP